MTADGLNLPYRAVCCVSHQRMTRTQVADADAGGTCHQIGAGSVVQSQACATASILTDCVL